jgi:hypothetical protein
LQNPLPAFVIGFREGDIGWSADIGAMFSRIRLKDIDRPYHRFLWSEKDGLTSICEMTRVFFLVSCSSYVAIRTTWRAADDAGLDMKETAVLSVAERGAAVEMMPFSLSDDPGLILGIVWNPSTDKLEFRVKPTTINYARMGLLAQVAGFLDPLGMATPMTIKAKIKLRELGVKDLKFDDPVVGDEKAWWEQ